MGIYEERYKKANEDVKRIKKSNAEFNKIHTESKNNPYSRSERIERRQQLLDAIHFRDVTLPFYEKLEGRLVPTKRGRP